MVFFIDTFDKDIWGYFGKRDDPVYREDVLETFLKTDSEKEPFYEIDINPKGTIYDAYNIRRRTAGGGHRWNK